jgi:hypothetical protein
VTTGQPIIQNPASISPTISSTYQANFSTPSVQVVVDQTLQTGASASSIGHWVNGTSFIQYAVPYTFNFGANSSQTLRATQDVFSGQRYHNWNENQANVVNPQVFGISTGSSSTLRAYLRETQNGVAIRNTFPEAPGANVGSVQFRDPWFIDYPTRLMGTTFEIGAWMAFFTHEHHRSTQIPMTLMRMVKNTMACF